MKAEILLKYLFVRASAVARENAASTERNNHIILSRYSLCEDPDIDKGSRTIFSCETP